MSIVKKSFFVKQFVLPLADKIMSTSLMKNYRQIQNMQKWSADEIVSWQNQKLIDLIKHAYYQTEYYNKLFKKNGINPNDIKNIADLNKIPILTKQDIIDNYNSLIAKNIEKYPHKLNSTGGSTGIPLKYILDKNSWSYSNANYLNYWEKAGYCYGDRYIALGSTSLFVNKRASIKHKLYYKLKNKIGLNGINMSDDICLKYIELINKNKVKFIYGYASSIYFLAKFALNRNLKISLNACFTTSEVLTDLYRSTIKMAFDCKIINCYGAHDGGITAFQIEDGVFEIGYTSILNLIKDETKNISPVFVTDLFNFAMPFINYELGDEVKLDVGIPSGNYNGQYIASVLGRTSDIMYLKNGRRLTGPGFTILFKDIPVDYYCLFKVNEEYVKIIIHKREEFNDKHELLIMETLINQLGTEIKIEFDYESPVIYSNSGKMKYFIG